MNLILWSAIAIIVLFFGSIGAYIGQDIWLRRQRRRYTTVWYKKMAGNMTDEERIWHAAADKHKYKSLNAVFNAKFKLIRRDLKAVIDEIKKTFEKKKEEKKTIEYVPIYHGKKRPERDNYWEKNLKQLDTAKLREDAMCAMDGYDADAERDQAGEKECHPFSGQKKTEAELQAEAILNNREETKKNEGKDLSGGHA